MEGSTNDSFSCIGRISTENATDAEFARDADQENDKHFSEQGQYELEAVTPESGVEVTPDKQCGEVESSALDLTTTRTSPEDNNSSLVIHSHNSPKKNMLSIADLLQSFYYNNSHFNNPPSKLSLQNNQVTNHAGNKDYFVLNSVKQTATTASFTEAATNTDLITMIDSGSQTDTLEMRDSAVQVDLAREITAPSVFKVKDESKVKYSCFICNRCYSSKCSYDRHIKTHGKIVNQKIMNVHLTAEAKLQIFKKPIVNKKLNVNKPIIIKVPQSTAFQCKLCQKYFPSQERRDEHSNCCELFPLTKCNECPAKFFTNGALKDHINFLHKNSLPSNDYFCVFCNERFNNSYTFQLHLDEHLST